MANVRKIKVDRVIDTESAIEEGLEPGETVVIEGQLQLNNGSKVNARAAKAGS